MNIKIKIFFTLLPIIMLIKNTQAVELTLEGRIYELYDDNIYTSSSNPESDWITNLMLGATVTSVGRSHELAITGNIYQQYGLKHEDRNECFQDLSLLLNKNFSENVSFSMNDTFHNYPEARTFGELYGRLDDSTGYISNEFNTLLSVYVTKKLFITATYSNNIMLNDSTLLSDSVEHIIGGSSGYNFNSANIFRIGYEYSTMKYDSGDKNRSDSYYAEYEKYFTKQLRTILHGGYDYIQTGEGESLNTSYEISVIDDVDENNQLEISFLNENTISNISNDTLDYWRVQGELRRQIGIRSRIEIEIFYGNGAYEVSHVEETLIGAALRFYFNMTDHIDFEIGYVYTWNSSVLPGVEEREYDRNQVSAGITAIY